MAQQQQQKPGEKSMSASSPSEAPPTAATSSRVGAAQESGWARPPSRMQQILWSGDRRAVFIGVLSVFALSSIPWLYFTRNAKHDSHADYMDRAEKARRERLSTSPSTSTTS
ncbi:hypothetical protein CY35_10G032800 [Sphagnum magellanicum]|nr:hypothetical protein CY35_10G032800 [Sphagnum magellanicum]